MIIKLINKKINENKKKKIIKYIKILPTDILIIVKKYSDLITLEQCNYIIDYYINNMIVENYLYNTIYNKYFNIKYKNYKLKNIYLNLYKYNYYNKYINKYVYKKKILIKLIYDYHTYLMYKKNKFEEKYNKQIIDIYKFIFCLYNDYGISEIDKKILTSYINNKKTIKTIDENIYKGYILKKYK